MSTYAGDSSNYPTSITLPDDGDPVTGSSVGVPLEGLADRCANLKAAIDAAVERTDNFVASGTWTCPVGVTRVRLIGVGGGGGGAGGNPGVSAAASQYSRSGSGGGGAPVLERTVTVVPGVTYTVTVGAGGAGGAANTAGSRGAASSFGSLATFPSGGGGYKASTAVTDATHIVVGGISGPGALVDDGPTIDTPDVTANMRLAGAGGIGVASFMPPNLPSKIGIDSLYGAAGGAGGTANGTDGGSYKAGAAGGGGGGSLGVGGAGGSGGNANGSGNGVAGAAGTAAAANTGAGGGGGGSGGSASGTGGAGGAGGAGGSGRVVVMYRGPAAVVA